MQQENPTLINPALSDLIQTILWIILIISLLFLYRRFIRNLIIAISRRVDRGDNLKIAGFELGQSPPPEIAKGIKEMATADKEMIPISTSIREKMLDDNYNKVNDKYYLIHHIQPFDEENKPETLKVKVWIEGSIEKVSKVTYGLSEPYHQIISTENKEKDFELWMNAKEEFFLMAMLESTQDGEVWISRYINLPGRPKSASKNFKFGDIKLSVSVASTSEELPGIAIGDIFIIPERQNLILNLKWESSSLPDKYAGYWEINYFIETFLLEEGSNMSKELLPASTQPMINEKEIIIPRKKLKDQVSNLALTVYLFSKIGKKIPLFGAVDVGMIFFLDIQEKINGIQIPIELVINGGSSLFNPITVLKGDIYTFEISWEVYFLNLEKPIEGKWKIEFYGQILGPNQGKIKNSNSSEMTEVGNSSVERFNESIAIDTKELKIGAYKTLFLVYFETKEEKITNLLGAKKDISLNVTQ